MKHKVRGYDTPQLFREDTFERIRQLEKAANKNAKEMNRIIKEGNLPEELLQISFPEAEDEECKSPFAADTLTDTTGQSKPNNCIRVSRGRLVSTAD